MEQSSQDDAAIRQALTTYFDACGRGDYLVAAGAFVPEDLLRWHKSWGKLQRLVDRVVGPTNPSAKEASVSQARLLPAALLAKVLATQLGSGGLPASASIEAIRRLDPWTAEADCLFSFHDLPRVSTARTVRVTLRQGRWRVRMYEARSVDEAGFRAALKSARRLLPSLFGNERE